MSKPNPEVYRVAADMIEKGEEGLSCFAIEAACIELGVRRDDIEMYIAQYGAMLGPYENAHVAGTKENPYADGTYVRGHPFWNQPARPCFRHDHEKMQQHLARINALLLMAEIVENPA